MLKDDAEVAMLQYISEMCIVELYVREMARGAISIVEGEDYRFCSVD